MSSDCFAMGFQAGIGGRLREERERLDLTQAQLAQKLGIWRRTVFNYETESNPVLLQYVDQLGQLGADRHYLLFGVSASAPVPRIDASVLLEAMEWAKEFCRDSKGRPAAMDKTAQFIAVTYEYLITADDQPREGRELGDVLTEFARKIA